MTVGFFSPLPPARTGVADYSAELLRALAPLGSVQVNARDSDVPLYHLGNNPMHREIYGRALRTPGVVVLHDAVLHHFFLGAGSEQEYVAEFVYNYGNWSEDLARELWRRRSRSGSPRRRWRPAIELPDRPAQSEIIRWRAAQGVLPHTFLVGVFGHLRESKRLMALLRAFQRARRSADMMLLVAGDFVSSDLARSVEPLLRNDPGILRTGYLEERDFWLCASAVDACVNLRYPMAGETSAIAIRLMGLGKPVMMTAGEETSRFPESACVRVDPGQAEEEMLVEYLVWLARHPDDSRAIGQRAAAYIGQYHAPARVAQLYWRALEDCYHKSTSTISSV